MEFQNSVSDFDLNFLAPPPRKTLIPNKLLKKSSVSYVKAKVMLTHKVVEKHNLMKSELIQSEQDLANTREQCRSITADYKVCLEQRNDLENKIEELQNENKILAERCFNAETQYGGLKSHINQLQVLITEYETQIKDFKSELKGKKDAIPIVHQDKKISILNKENVTLKKHISSLVDVIRKKKKVNKTIQNILDKYINPNSNDGKTLNHEGDEFEDVPMFDSEDSYDTVIVPPTPNSTMPAICNNTIIRNDSVEIDTIDGRSLDTGRGSSLAFSDGEKSFHSPEYYMDDSPLMSEIIQNHENKKSYKNNSTSPMINTPKCRDNSTSPIPKGTISRDFSTSPMPIHKRTVATSPIIFRKNIVHMDHDTAEKVERGVSPIKIVECWSSRNKRGAKELKNVAVDTRSLDTEVNNRSSITNERKCLERNNSVILSEDRQNDPEVEMILSEMTLHQQLITPIPPTPLVNSRRSGNNRIEESMFDMTGRDGVSMFAKIDAVYDLVFSMKERLPHLFNAQANTSQPPKSCKKMSFTDENNINEKSNVPNNVVQHEQLIHVEDSVDCGDIESNNNNVDKLCLGNNQLDPIEEESDNDLIINEDIEPEDTTQVDYPDNHRDRFSPEPIKKINISESLEKPTKPLKSVRKVKKKLTGLDKMRLRFVPKPKIKQQQPVKKLRFKPNKILVPKKVTEKDSAASLNDKDVYEKAVKVMAELKSKKCMKIPTIVIEDCSKTMEKFLVSPQKDTSDKNDKITPQINCSPNSKAVKSIEKDKATVCNDSALSVSNDFRKSVKRLSFSETVSTHKELLNKKDNKTSEVHFGKECNGAKYPESNDKLLNTPNSAALLISERRKSVKRVSVSENEGKRTLRPRQKSNSLTDVNSPTVENSNVSNVDNIKKISADTDTSELCTTPVKRRRLRSRQSSDESHSKIISQDQNKNTSTKRNSFEAQPLSPSQRILRSSIRQETDVDMRVANEVTNTVSNISGINGNCNMSNKRNTRVPSHETPKRKKSIEEKANSLNVINEAESNKIHSKSQVDYSDLDLFSAQTNNKQQKTSHSNKDTEMLNQPIDPKASLLCSMIEKYGVISVNSFTRKPPDAVINKVCDKLEKDIENINKLNSPENKYAMVKLVTQIGQLGIKDFIYGFMKYLKDPNRKAEMYNIIVSHPAPPMTKSEQVLIFLIAELRNNWQGIDLVNAILENIQYVLFNLNRSPDFHMIESMAHFYAVLCRYYKLQSKLRMFILDSLYCLQFKAVPLIKQCLEVWMHILPLAHMGQAKIPLVTCLVYLLHFYKCDDKFNRVQELRTILKHKYFYHVTEWNETKILEMFRTSIKELRGCPIETKMLRLALIILGKRQGPKWCLKNIIKGILQPMISDNETPRHVRIFCISLMGPLLKPFPNDMKVHCEIVVSKLMEILDQQPSQDEAETIFITLIYFCKHNEMRLMRYLLKWNPPKISSEFEEVLQNYVQSKPMKSWKYLLSKCLTCD